MNTLQLTLPWPPADLSPNARQHWSKLARACGNTYNQGGHRVTT